MPVARAQDNRDDNRLSGRVPLHRALHLEIVAIVGGDKVGADEQQNDVVGFDMLLDSASKLLACADPPVMPGLDNSLTLQEGELGFHLVPQRLINVGI